MVFIKMYWKENVFFLGQIKFVFLPYIAKILLKLNFLIFFFREVIDYHTKKSIKYKKLLRMYNTWKYFMKILVIISV